MEEPNRLRNQTSRLRRAYRLHGKGQGLRAFSKKLAKENPKVNRFAGYAKGWRSRKGLK